MSQDKAVITAENLYKTFETFQALKGISFTVQAGECYGFLGHNGAGKTTTMRMIYGMSTVSQGTLRIFDQSISLTPPSIKSRLGVIPQEDNLDPDLSVRENLEVYGRLYGLSRASSQQKALELLQFMNLAEKADDSVEHLSGGLKRRLVIARALINRPEIVILDEPTTGLDPQARHLVWQKLRSLKAEGVTLLLTTHYMEEAVQLCDRLAIMHEGRILEEGSPRELIGRCVLPHVVEVHLPISGMPDGLESQVRAMGGEVVQVAEGLFLYAHDGQEIWDALPRWGLPQHSCFLRPANLEDVFLKLTGGHGGENT
ncbi:MAG TPA: ABC transporter ATP-binding protein [Patescibacteria group bacterium]|nr:ABC transporter ATP-binding protein [Patescibacteria group bacterium]